MLFRDRIVLASLALALVATLAGLGLLVAFAIDGGGQEPGERVVVPGVTKEGQAGATPSPSPQALEEFDLLVQSDEHERVIRVQVAATQPERSTGLMWVTEMGEDEGMLFLFPNDRRGGFWMRNTFIPLDIAFLDQDGVVLEVHGGVPLDETLISPSEAYRNVLEMNRGWFERHGFGPGSRLVLPEGLPEAR